MRLHHIEKNTKCIPDLRIYHILHSYLALFFTNSLSFPFHLAAIFDLWPLSRDSVVRLRVYGNLLTLSFTICTAYNTSAVLYLQINLLMHYQWCTAHSRFVSSNTPSAFVVGMLFQIEYEFARHGIVEHYNSFCCNVV